MKVLVACEESQEVCKAFRERGHEAYSCDIQECSGGHPEWHIQGDVLEHLEGGTDKAGFVKGFITQNGEMHVLPLKWDLIIAHPPCTYLTNGGAVRMFRKEKKEFQPYGTFQMVNVERLKQGMQGRDFFMSILGANCDRIAVENPIPMSIYMLPQPTQTIQPYEYGECYSKKTCLWLKGLPRLTPTDIQENYSPLINGGGGRMERPNYKGKKFAVGSKARSKTFPGVAKAMAEQWG